MTTQDERDTQRALKRAPMPATADALTYLRDEAERLRQERNELRTALERLAHLDVYDQDLAAAGEMAAGYRHGYNAALWRVREHAEHALRRAAKRGD